MNMRQTMVKTADTQSRFTSFDKLGRVKSYGQVTNGATYSFPTYTYNLADGLTSVTYPSGRVVTNEFDGAGRVSAVKATPPTGGTARYYTSSASPISYAPHGAISQMTLGNGRVEIAEFNARMQPVRIGLRSSATSYLVDLGLAYCPNEAATCTSNNGNIISQKMSRPKAQGGSLVLRQDYEYDGLNRLSKVSEAPVAGATGNDWSIPYDYDRYGNQWVKAEATVPIHFAAARSEMQYNAATNRLLKRYDGQDLAANAYDASGNLVNHPHMGQASYDAEGRIVSFGGGAVTFGYDGDGRRVRKTAGAQVIHYVYDAGGNLVAEYGGVLSIGGTEYQTADHLGSTRLTTNAAGAIVEPTDYLPFGEEIAANATNGNRNLLTGVGGAAGSTLKFTGKERDAETGLEYLRARYFSGAQGRFTSPDPSLNSGKVEDPQTWNRYAYVTI